MRGVCPVCQDVVPCRSANGQVFREMEVLGWEFEDVQREFGESVYWLLDTHESYGAPCEGSGQVPEALIKDE